MRVVYENDGIKLICGDFREVVPQLGEFDAVVTDPPYGQTTLKWDRWVSGWPSLMPGSSLWCFGSFRMFVDRWAEFESWKLSQELVWEKHNGSGMHADRFKRVHELAVHFYRGAWAERYHETPTTNDATKRTIRRKQKPAHMGPIAGSTFKSIDGGPRLMRSVIRARSMHGNAIHPTEKPEALIVPLIEYACPPGGIVLDCFAGSGSTLRAARLAGRRAVGIELNSDFCERAVESLRQKPLVFSRAQ